MRSAIGSAALLVVLAALADLLLGQVDPEYLVALVALVDQEDLALLLYYLYYHFYHLYQI